jgi:Family of unknown function (DUF6364)
MDEGYSLSCTYNLYLYVSLLKLEFMKTKLTLSIDEEKVKKIKRYARQKETSISNIVEEHFEKLISKPSTKKLNASELVGLFGKAPKNFNPDKVRWEHLKKKHGL